MTTAATSNTTTVKNSHGSSDQAGENKESSKIKSDITSSNKQRVNDQEKDYIFFAKAILEKVPLHGNIKRFVNHVSIYLTNTKLLHYTHHSLNHTQSHPCLNQLNHHIAIHIANLIPLHFIPLPDRHFALLLFARGFFAPPYTIAPRINLVNSGLSVLQLDHMGVSYRESMRKLGITQPSLSSRVLYPFAFAAVRANAEIRASSGSISTKASSGVGSKSSRARLGDGSIGGYEVKDVNEQWRRKLRGNKVVGWGLDDDDEEGGVTLSNGGVGSDISSSISSDRNNGGISGGSGINGFADIDLRLCRLLQGCMQEDIQADRMHALSGAGNMLH